MVSDVGFELVIGFSRIIWTSRVSSGTKKVQAHESVLTSVLGLLTAF